MASKVQVKKVAESLPVGSVVVMNGRALYKYDSSWSLSWGSSAGGSATNKEVDEYLRRGAKIVRMGETVLPSNDRHRVPLNGLGTLHRVIDNLSKNPSPEDLLEEKKRVFTVPDVKLLRPSSPTETADPEFYDWEEAHRWHKARLRDSSLPECPIRAPHNPHRWGKHNGLRCEGQNREPENLSFGSVVAEVLEDGRVENWLKVSEGKYAWRDESGKTHTHAVIVEGVKKGKYIIIRYGL